MRTVVLTSALFLSLPTLLVGTSATPTAPAEAKPAGPQIPQADAFRNNNTQDDDSGRRERLRDLLNPTVKGNERALDLNQPQQPDVVDPNELNKESSSPNLLTIMMQMKSGRMPQHGNDENQVTDKELKEAKGDMAKTISVLQKMEGSLAPDTDMFAKKNAASLNFLDAMGLGKDMLSKLSENPLKQLEQQGVIGSTGNRFININQNIPGTATFALNPEGGLLFRGNNPFTRNTPMTAAPLAEMPRMTPTPVITTPQLPTIQDFAPPVNMDAFRAPSDAFRQSQQEQQRRNQLFPQLKNQF